MKLIIKIILILNLCLTLSAQVREPDISRYLTMVQNGQVNEVKAELPKLQMDYPNSAGVILLMALTTDDGNEALNYYLRLLDSTYQNNKYYDIACYKLFQYYYATNNFFESDKYAKILLRDFPESQYTQMIAPASKSEVKKQVEETIKKDDNSAVKFRTEEKPTQPQFTIQLGAFLERKNAESLRAKLTKYKSARIVEQQVKGSLFYVVLVGEFNQREEAENYNQKILNETKLKGVVVTLK